MANTGSPQNSNPPAQAVGNTSMINGIQIHQQADSKPNATSVTPLAQSSNPVYSSLPSSQAGVSQPQTVINPNIPGQPFMGQNAQQANYNANVSAGASPAPTGGCDSVCR